MSDKPKHNYADTSVLIPLLLAPSDYVDYLVSAIGPQGPYYTAYNLMEFKNAVICRCIAMYSAVRMAHYRTTQDAFYYFAQQFNDRNNIMLLSILGQILQQRMIDLNDPTHKEIAASEIWRVIKELDRKFALMFIDCGDNRTHCVRAGVEINFDADDKLLEAERFIKEFSGTNHRPNCRVDDLIEKRYREEAAGFVQKATTVTGQAAEGFRKQAKRVDNVLKGTAARTCAQCASMGDAVITLQAPRQMRLVHTDNSFNYLCEVTKQEHLKLDYPGTFDRQRKS